LEEFARKGFAGARVQDIATRAGLSQQLITYYFGGKQGLAQAVKQSWETQEATFAGSDKSLEQMVTGYVHATLANPLMARMFLWEGLNSDEPSTGQTGVSPLGSPDVTELARRQAAGELSGDVDPRFVLLIFMGAVAAPIIMPQVARRVTGLEPDSQEFEARYANELRVVLHHLRG
jgi:AcrR family transcriptional regulator